MVTLRPAFLSPANNCRSIPISMGDPGFICHPATSELAEQLMIDPESLARENYSGLYDENGDLVPQYLDDPEKLPRSMQMKPNAETPSQPSVESPAVTEGQKESKSASTGDVPPGE